MNISKLKKALDDAKENFIIPSYSMTLYKDGEEICLNSGYMDVNSKKETNSDTLYAIGSCTKSFTAATICTLVDKGIVSLDGCIKEYIPEFDMYDKYAADNLTVRDILCHRSGLQRHEFSWYLRLGSLNAEDIVNLIPHLKPSNELRYKWQYSNHMFVLAGYLIEKVTGQKWQDVMTCNLLVPLGIKRYAFDAKRAQEMENCATPYTPDLYKMEKKAVNHANMFGIGTAGGLYMSSKELAKWNNLLLNKGKYGEKQIISQEMVEEMMKTQMVIGDDEKNPLKGVTTYSGYGLGLGTTLFKGHRMAMHAGSIDGFMSAQFILPDDDVAGVILTNLDTIHTAAYMRTIIVEHCIDGKDDWGKAFYNNFLEEISRIKNTAQKLVDEKPDNAPCPVPIKNICGKYNNLGYGDMEVCADGYDLILKIGTHEIKAIHYANQYFYFGFSSLLPGVKMELKLDINIQGEVIGVEAGFDFETKEYIYFKRKT